MGNKTLYLIWGGLFIVCGLLGFIPEPTGALSVFLTVVAVGFFLPGWIVLIRARREKNPAAASAVCWISALSLSFTLLLLVLNFLSGNAPQAAGEFLYSLLVIFSAPMVCSQYWVASLFLWACLLMTGWSMVRKLKKRR